MDVRGSQAAAKQGWMTKQGGIMKNWKKRFFILNTVTVPSTLSYYAREDDHAKGVRAKGEPAKEKESAKDDSSAS